MKKSIALIVCIFLLHGLQAQTVVINQTPCTEADVQMQPALYYNHTKPKYGPPGGMGTYNASEKTKILKTLDSFEKLEESSRTNFQATGCVMRVSYHGSGKNLFAGYSHASYEYQLGLYQMVCHIQQHVIKEVGEYRSVLRINANPDLTKGGLFGEHADFYITDKTVRYDVPIDAKWSASYDKDRISNRSRIAQFASAGMLLLNRSDNESDFQKLNNGDGYTDTRMQGDKSSKYQLIRRTWLITKKGIPLLVPVTRKELLEALLEYYEIEKFNFEKAAGYAAESQKSKLAVISNDKTAYNQVYENKKARISNLLRTQGADWLGKQAYVPSRFANALPGGNDYAQASNGLFDIKQFDAGIALYKYNPDYYKLNTADPTKPVCFEIEFRFEKNMERTWSENLLNNFMKNFDFNALGKMIDN